MGAVGTVAGGGSPGNCYSMPVRWSSCVFLPPLSHIQDPVNKYVVLDAISFHFDKEKCRTILDKVSPLQYLMLVLVLCALCSPRTLQPVLCICNLYW